MIALAADVTQEELQVFLQDTDEQLQVLDQDVLNLEKESANEELLQKIFRAAHTIKGSSAMLGYEQMAKLTHAMESILDKLRKRTLCVSTQLANALLNSLDVLRVLRNNLTDPEETAVDIAPAIAMLEELGAGRAPSSSPAQAEAACVTAGEVMPCGEEAKSVLESLALNHKVFDIDVSIDDKSGWKAVRCLQVLCELEEKGKVISSMPTREEIEAENAGSHLRIIFAGLLEKEDIGALLRTVAEIDGVHIEPYDPSSATHAASQALSSGEAPGPAAEQSGAAPKSQEPAAKRAAEATKMAETVRIDVERLDNLMNEIGELVVARTRLNEIGKALEKRYKDDTDVASLCKTFTHISKVMDELQLDITAARMMPVGTVFSRLPRLVRDLAQKMGKDIDFIVTGQETGIDRSVVEHIRDPLVHLLRNCVDHGVESPEKRREAGKPATAVISLAAAHEQNCIVITIEDDGKGIDGAVIRDAAVKKGVIAAEAAARMGESECIDLIFEAGVTTAKKTTEVSGRGVGMDIVRKNLEALNGNIVVETKVGQGTKFTLRLPLTLATIQGLLVSSGDTKYAIPMVSISTTLRLRPEDIQTASRKEVIRLRDRVVPLIRLDAILDADNHHRRDADASLHVVVVRTGERMVGLAVDSLISPQEVLVKSLGGILSNTQGVAGASILGSGEVAMILDVPGLVKLATQGDSVSMAS